jgi:hypothetical protein
VNRPAARQDRDKIEAHRQAGMVRLARQPEIGGGFDAAQRIRRDGVHRLGQRRPRLDLDDGDEIAAPGDQVDLAGGRAIAAGEDAEALEAKGEGGQRLAAMAEAIGGAATFCLAGSVFILQVQQAGIEVGFRQAGDGGRLAAAFETDMEASRSRSSASVLSGVHSVSPSGCGAISMTISPLTVSGANCSAIRRPCRCGSSRNAWSARGRP